MRRSATGQSWGVAGDTELNGRRVPALKLCMERVGIKWVYGWVGVLGCVQAAQPSPADWNIVSKQVP